VDIKGYPPYVSAEFALSASGDGVPKGDVQLEAPSRGREELAARMLAKFNRFNRAINLVRLPLHTLGSVLAGYNLYQFRDARSAVVVGVFLFFWGVELLNRKGVKNYGMIRDSVSRESLQGAIVSLYGKDKYGLDTATATVASNYLGKYFLTLTPGTYQMVVTHPTHLTYREGERTYASHVQATKDISLLPEQV
jgi:hypothetical protein